MDSATGPATSQKSSVPNLAEFFENHHGNKMNNVLKALHQLNILFVAGLVHLEALEMLSQQCQNRVGPQIRRLTAQRRTAVEEVAQLCSQSADSLEEQDNPDDFDLDLLEQSIPAYFDRIGIEVSSKKLMEAFRRASDSNDADVSGSMADIFKQSLDSLALVTSAAIELIHKSAELLLMTAKSANPAAGGRLEAETFHRFFFNSLFSF